MVSTMGGGEKRGTSMSIGIRSPAVRTHTPPAAAAVGRPAVATSIMTDEWKMRGETKT